MMRALVFLILFTLGTVSQASDLEPECGQPFPVDLNVIDLDWTEIKDIEFNLINVEKNVCLGNGDSDIFKRETALLGLGMRTFTGDSVLWAGRGTDAEYSMVLYDLNLKESGFIIRKVNYITTISDNVDSINLTQEIYRRGILTEWSIWTLTKQKN